MSLDISFNSRKKPIASRLFLLPALFILSLSSIAQVVPATNAPRPLVLTEQESVRLGLARPDIATLIEATLDTARSDVREAARWPNPRLEYQRESIPTTPNRNIEQSYQLSQEFDLSGRRRLRRDAAEERLSATVAETEQRQVEMTAEIRRRFYEVLYRQQLVAATQAWDRRMAAISDTVQKLHKGGEVAGYDRRRMALERLTAETRLRTEQAEYDKGWQRLAAIVGDPAMSATLNGELLPTNVRPLEALLTRLDERPDLRALERRAGAFDLDRRAAQRGWIPDVTIGIGPKTVDNGVTRDTGTLVTLSVPLPLLDREQPAQQRAAAQAEVARSEFRLARTKLEGELRALWQQVRQMSATASDYRNQSAGASQELARIAEAAYRGGETGILELLDAYRAVLDAESRALELEWNTRQAAIELDMIVGNGKP